MTRNLTRLRPRSSAIRRTLVAVVGAVLLVSLSVGPAVAKPGDGPGHRGHGQAAIATSFRTIGISGAGRQTYITISSTGRSPLYVTSISQNSNPLSGSCVRTWVRAGSTCEFIIGWAGGPGGGPNGPVVTIVSNAVTSPTVIQIPYQ